MLDNKAVDDIDRVLMRVIEQVKTYRFSDNDKSTDRKTNEAIKKILESEFQRIEG